MSAHRTRAYEDVADAVAHALYLWKVSRLSPRQIDQRAFSNREVSRRVGRDIGQRLNTIMKGGDCKISTLADIGHAIGMRLIVAFEPEIKLTGGQK